MEAGLVIDTDGRVVYRHTPKGRTAGSLPDNNALWFDGIVPHLNRIEGIAHSHPGGGVPGPSYTDITTFVAIEKAIGRIKWWITSSEAVVVCCWVGPGEQAYEVTRLEVEPAWTDELRQLSQPLPSDGAPSN